MKSDTFTADSFWPAFERDLSNAQARVIIQSPFIASRRVAKLQHGVSKLVERNVRLCFFLQAPNRYKSFREWYHSLTVQEQRQADDVMRAIEWLESQGVHINLRSRIHEKLAVVDKSILWEGSLNILSHRDTKERMRRIRSATEVQTVVQEQRFNECELCAKYLIQTGNRNVAETLTKARESESISQRGLAEASGVKQSTISRAELADESVSVGAIRRMACALGFRIMAVPEWMAPAVVSMYAKSIAEDAKLKDSKQRETKQA